MAASDSITTQLKIAIDPSVDKVIQELNQRLKQHVQDTFQNAAKRGVEFERVTSIGTRQVESKGKQLDITGKVKQDIDELPEFSVSVKETKRNFNREINADLKKTEKDVGEIERQFSEQEQLARQQARSRKQAERKRRSQEIDKGLDQVEEGVGGIERQLSEQEKQARLARQQNRNRIQAERKRRSSEINKDLDRTEQDVGKMEQFFTQQEKEIQAARNRSRQNIQRERRQQLQAEKQREIEERRQVSATRGQQMEGRRNFSNMGMLAAGTGLGLLGNAGFPLLNIGFAAMTGNPLGVAVVAVATAVGESARALERFNASAIEAAKSIGYVSTDLKRIEGRTTAFSAFTAAGSNASETVAQRNIMNMWKDQEGGISEWNRGYTDFKKTWQIQWNAIKRAAVDSSTISTSPFILATWRKQREESAAQLPIERKQALQNAIAQLMGKPVGIENDPYEVWKRIQTSALDNTKTEELLVARDMLKELKDLNSKVTLAPTVAPQTGVVHHLSHIFGNRW